MNKRRTNIDSVLHLCVVAFFVCLYQAAILNGIFLVLTLLLAGLFAASTVVTDRPIYKFFCLRILPVNRMDSSTYHGL